MSTINAFKETKIEDFGWVDVNVDQLATASGVKTLEALIEEIIPSKCKSVAAYYATFDSYNQIVSTLFSEWTRKYPKIFNEQYVLDNISQIDKMLETCYMPIPNSQELDGLRVMQVQIPHESSFVFWNTIKFMMIIGGHQYFEYRGVQSKFLDATVIKSHINNILRPDISVDARNISEAYIIDSASKHRMGSAVKNIEAVINNRNKFCKNDSVSNAPSIYNLSYQYNPSIIKNNGIAYPIVDMIAEESVQGENQYRVKWMKTSVGGDVGECSYNGALANGFHMELCSDRDSRAFVAPIAFYHQKSRVVVDCTYSINTISFKPEEYVQYINWCIEVGFKKSVSELIKPSAAEDIAEENKQEQRRESHKEELEKLLTSIRNPNKKNQPEDEKEVRKDAYREIKDDQNKIDPEVSKKHVCAGKCKSGVNDQVEAYLRKLESIRTLINALDDFGIDTDEVDDLHNALELLIAGAKLKFPEALKLSISAKINKVAALKDLFN